MRPEEQKLEKFFYRNFSIFLSNRAMPWVVSGYCYWEVHVSFHLFKSSLFVKLKL